MPTALRNAYAAHCYKLKSRAGELCAEEMATVRDRKDIPQESLPNQGTWSEEFSIGEP